MREVILVDDDIDGDTTFFSLLDAIESEASAKRKRQKTEPAAEGPYLAALRGSRSSLWQQQQEELRHLHKKKSNTFSDAAGGGGGGGGGGCFKCGMEGHWARDCTAKKEGSAGAGAGAWAGTEGEVAEKACPCGLGSCLVLTSNTPKNPGRKFYRCPLREENGGCNFFEWCDNPSSGLPTSGSAANYRSNTSVLDFPCPCGAGSCLILVAKTGNNAGKQFYRCPANEGSGSCGYFKWCNEPTSVPLQPAFSLQTQGACNSSGGRQSGDRNSSLHSAFSLQTQGAYNSSGGRQSGERNSSSCFKCGEDGHWARDCTKPTSDPYTDAGGNRLASAGSGSCFKCGKTGHWARDCNVQGPSGDNSSQKTRVFRTPYVNKY